MLAAARQLDDAILHLRFNEPELGTWVLRTEGSADDVVAAEAILADDHWLAREVRLFWARTLKRLDLSARTLVALVEPGSCFAGTLAELALAADRTLMLDGTREDVEPPPATLRLTAANDGWYPMSNGLSRLATRFWGRDDDLQRARDLIGKDLLAAEAVDAGLVTVRSTSSTGTTRCACCSRSGPASRPTPSPAWRRTCASSGRRRWRRRSSPGSRCGRTGSSNDPNAVGPEGALRSYGTGSRPTYDRARV